MLEVPKQTLLDLLYARDYSINIATKEDSQVVTFNHPIAQHSFQLLHSYAKSFTKEEIRLDCAQDLLEWTGLKVKYTLDY